MADYEGTRPLRYVAPAANEFTTPADTRRQYASDLLGHDPQMPGWAWRNSQASNFFGRALQWIPQTIGAGPKLSGPSAVIAPHPVVPSGGATGLMDMFSYLPARRLEAAALANMPANVLNRARLGENRTFDQDVDRGVAARDLNIRWDPAVLRALYHDPLRVGPAGRRDSLEPTFDDVSRADYQNQERAWAEQPEGFYRDGGSTPLAALDSLLYRAPYDDGGAVGKRGAPDRQAQPPMWSLYGVPRTHPDDSPHHIPASLIGDIPYRYQGVGLHGGLAGAASIAAIRNARPGLAGFMSGWWPIAILNGLYAYDSINSGRTAPRSQAEPGTSTLTGREAGTPPPDVGLIPREEAFGQHSVLGIPQRRNGGITPLAALDSLLYRAPYDDGGAVGKRGAPEIPITENVDGVLTAPWAIDQALGLGAGMVRGPFNINTSIANWMFPNSEAVRWGTHLINEADRRAPVASSMGAAIPTVQAGLGYAVARNAIRYPWFRAAPGAWARDSLKLTPPAMGLFGAGRNIYETIMAGPEAVRGHGDARSGGVGAVPYRDGGRAPYDDGGEVEPATLGGDTVPLPNIIPQTIQPRVGQHNFIHHLLSALGRPSVEAFGALQRGEGTADDVALTLPLPFGGRSPIAPPARPMPRSQGPVNPDNVRPGWTAEQEYGLSRNLLGTGTGPGFRYQIYNRGNHIGGAGGEVLGDTAHINYITTYGAGPLGSTPNSLGVSGIRALREAMRSDFPDVVNFIGARSSGSRRGPAARPGTNVEQNVTLYAKGGRVGRDEGGEVPPANPSPGLAALDDIIYAPPQIPEPAAAPHPTVFGRFGQWLGNLSPSAIATEMGRRIMASPEPEPDTLGPARAPLPNVIPHELRGEQIGQHNLIHHALASFGQPTVDALQQARRGEIAPDEVAMRFLETGATGPFGMVRAPTPVPRHPDVAGYISAGTLRDSDAVAQAIMPRSLFNGRDIRASQNYIDQRGLDYWFRQIRDGARPAVLLEETAPDQYRIVDGHTRATAYARAGIEDIPVLIRQRGEEAPASTPPRGEPPATKGSLTTRLDEVPTPPRRMILPSDLPIQSDGANLVVRSPIGNGIVEGRVTQDGRTLMILGSRIFDPGSRGHGIGLAMYQRLIDEAHRRGLVVTSDTTVSDSARRIYDALAARGYVVERNPSAATWDGALGGMHVPGYEAPVFTVRPPPPLEGPPVGGRGEPPATKGGQTWGQWYSSLLSRFERLIGDEGIMRGPQQGYDPVVVGAPRSREGFSLSPNGRNGNRFHYTIYENGRAIGDVRGNVYGDVSTIDWMGANRNLGIPGLRAIQDQMLQDFPGIRTFEGGRISGARGSTGGDGQRQSVRMKRAEGGVVPGNALAALDEMLYAVPIAAANSR